MKVNASFQSVAVPDYFLWNRMRAHRIPLSMELEITARCNNNCRHCYINLPADDAQARSSELSFEKVCALVDQAVEMGTLWCLITGGEPLLRRDFADIYLYLKNRGLLVSVFTNATLVRESHIRLFQRYPPRSIEVTVYGVTPETYEKVTRRPGSFVDFRRGLDRLQRGGIPITLKAMALRSNLREIDRIARFCRRNGAGHFRFDPFLHFRYDRDPARNRDIAAERLTPSEIVALESADPQRYQRLVHDCSRFISIPARGRPSGKLFGCSAGRQGWVLSPDGQIRACASLWHPNFLFDTRQRRLSELWEEMGVAVSKAASCNPEYLSHCNCCPIINLCMWCPANAYLETGALDVHVNEYCRLAQARLEMLAGCFEGAMLDVFR